MSDFKARHFEGEIVLWAVRWYCRYGVSYRDLEQMMGRERRCGRSFDGLPLGSKVRARDREAAPLAVAPAVLDQLARRRDLRVNRPGNGTPDRRAIGALTQFWCSLSNGSQH